MKTKTLLLTTAAALIGSLTLHAQDAPKPPAEGGARSTGGDGPGRLDEMLKKIDTNGDGKISKEEWLEFSRKESDDRFSKMDANKDGTVDKAEMEEGARKMRDSRGQGGGDRPGGFRKPETGNTAPQPPGEGGPRMTGGGGMREIYRKIMEAGSITKEEFGKINEEQFNTMDSNHDGKVTKEELEESMKKMRESFGGRGQGGAQGGGERPQNPPGGGEGGFRKRPEGNSVKPKQPDGA